MRISDIENTSFTSLGNLIRHEARKHTLEGRVVQGAVDTTTSSKSTQIYSEKIRDKKE